MVRDMEALVKSSTGGKRILQAGAGAVPGG
jgi:hypothetical protein